MRLNHLHLPRPIPYAYSLHLQEALVEQHLAHKVARRKDATLKSQAPAPTLLTFQTHPTYTVGRRHLRTNPLSSRQISFLTGAEETNDFRPSLNAKHNEDLATFFPSPRGGLLTYHAPGQLTAYLVLNLRRHNLTPRCYIRLLENTVMRTCARQGVPNVMTTPDPGVWIAEKGSQIDSSTQQHEQQEVTYQGVNAVVNNAGLRPTNRKICAIGVHVSQGITSHGIGLNVFDARIQATEDIKGSYTLPKDNIYTVADKLDHHNDNTNSAELNDSHIPAPGYLSWGFSRIVACGLEGKSVTWLSREQQSQQDAGHSDLAVEEQSRTLLLENVADSLAQEFAQSLNIDPANVDKISEDHILAVNPRSWDFLRSLSGGDQHPPSRASDHYQLRDLRQDTGLRTH